MSTSIWNRGSSIYIFLKMFLAPWHLRAIYLFWILLAMYIEIEFKIKFSSNPSTIPKKCICRPSQLA